LQDGRKRIVIEALKPEIDCGRIPVKRTEGEEVTVEADILAEGHDAIAGVLRYRHEGDSNWTEVSLEPLLNDRWRASFQVTQVGTYCYTVQAWVDSFRTWCRDLVKRIEADEDLPVDFAIGAGLIEEAADRAPEEARSQLVAWATALRDEALSREQKRILALDPEKVHLASRHPDRRNSTTYSSELTVVVDRTAARFSAWYEMFPRSTSPAPGRPGTLRDCIALLPYVASMGFDVLYLPPIHPIGKTNRKGKNNAERCGAEDVGSPWAIGAAEGGHKSVHPELGTLEDFRALVVRAKEHGLEIALDIAFQCSPDHPYVKQHPEWFRWRPDGTLQYAENPPKKYQDIYPFEFDCEGWRELWEELRSVFLFWADQGVRIFRVDNPHTKPYRFWKWVVAEVKKAHPEAIFLAEAFTRPKVMHRLAKLGFTQSYTYFAWRNTPYEIRRYFEELTQTEVREFFRPNLWPNTPDILTEYLQYGGRPAFMSRAVLAATLGASWGIYGPAFELCENTAREPGSEEYLNSEKYEVRWWDRDRPGSLKDFIARLNRIRRSNAALQSDSGLRFHETGNEQLICYSKHSPDFSNIVLVVVNLDPHHTQGGWVTLDLDALRVPADRPFQAHDLLSEARFLWQGSRNYVELRPDIVPAHVFVLRRRLRTERQFDYYM
jgi:starch synthase (maltosyl-transferring)